MTFVEVLEATAALACFENVLKSRFIVIGKSAITLLYCIRVRSEKTFLIYRIFNTGCNKRFVLYFRRSIKRISL